MSTPEDPIDRLRASDPAADVTPRARFAEEVVARAMSDDAGATAAPAAAEPIDLQAERELRRPRRVLAASAIAASVAAALVVGGATGYGFGLGQQPPTSTIAMAPEVGHAPVDAAIAPNQGGTSDAIAGAESKFAIPYFSGRTVFHGPGFSTAPGVGEVYAYDPTAVTNAETVAALAAAIGLEGTPELRDGSWQLTRPEGDTLLWLSLDSQATFSYWTPFEGEWPWSCVEGAECVIPSEEEAINAMREVISAVGLDAEAFTYTSEVYDGSSIRNVTATPADGDTLGGGAWYMEYTTDGVWSLSGSLAPTVSLGEYALVSEQEAFERMNDPRFGAQQTGWAAVDGVVSTMPVDQEWVPPTEPPAAPAPGTKIVWSVSNVDLVSVELGSMSQSVQTGDQWSVVLVPAYEFTDTNGNTWSVIALADEALEFTEAPVGDVRIMY